LIAFPFDHTFQATISETSTKAYTQSCGHLRTYCLRLSNLRLKNYHAKRKMHKELFSS